MEKREVEKVVAGMYEDDIEAYIRRERGEEELRCTSYEEVKGAVSGKKVEEMESFIKGLSYKEKEELRKEGKFIDINEYGLLFRERYEIEGKDVYSLLRYNGKEREYRLEVWDFEREYSNKEGIDFIEKWDEEHYRV